MSVFNPETGEYTNLTLSLAGEKLFLSKDFADFHFIFKSKSADCECERVPAHRTLLAMSSDVLRVMFNGSWKEKVDVEIVDASADAFKEFLQFFYLGKVKLTMENVAVVMNLGKKYDVAECFKTCGKFLRNNLTDDDIFWAHELAIHLEQDEVIKYCETVIGLNIKAVFASEGFLKSDKKAVSRILKLDFLSCTEPEAFEALLNWIKATAEEKEILRGQFDDLFHDIRFELMTLQEFFALDSNLISSDKYREIVQLISSKENQARIKKDRNDVEKMKCGGTVNCYRVLAGKYSLAPYFIKNVETTTFSTNEPLLLKSFRCALLLGHANNAYLFGADVPTEITIVELPNMTHSEENGEKISYDQKVNIESKKSTEVKLSKPILVKPGFTYEIRMKMNPPEKCCTGVQLKSKKEIGSDIVIQFHKDPTVEAENLAARGIVYELAFERI